MQVVRLKPYLRAMKAMGLGEPEMREVEAMILAAPEAHSMIAGLRGVRKVRFARPGTGRSGGGRAIYYVMISKGLLFLLTAYSKSERDDLSPDQRKAILRAIESIKG
jgi:hypothetical protein